MSPTTSKRDVLLKCKHKYYLYVAGKVIQIQRCVAENTFDCLFWTTKGLFVFCLNAAHSNISSLLSLNVFYSVCFPQGKDFNLSQNEISL